MQEAGGHAQGPTNLAINAHGKDHLIISQDELPLHTRRTSILQTAGHALKIDTEDVTSNIHNE